ncbi:MAG: hypothetical protein ACHQ0J_06140 [Candidatus Dormibacterales bacterium]
MPSAAVLAPVALLVLGSAAVATLGLLGVNAGRLGAGVSGAGAALALVLVWVPVRSTQELNLGSLGFGPSFDLRLDAVAFAFGLMVLLPAAVLMAMQRRRWQEAAVGTLGLAAAIVALEAGDVVLTAVAGGTAATLAVVQLDSEDEASRRPRWSELLAAWLILGLAGAILQVRGGTAAYSAVPATSFTGPVFVLLAVSALLASGLVPWKAWPSQLWSRPSTRAAGMTVATLYPLGFYLLVRGYEMGNGHYPVAAFSIVLGALGVLIAFGAAMRAQAAATRGDFLGEVVPGFGGFALMTLALGEPLGLAASLTTLSVAAALTTCIALLPRTSGAHSLVAVAAAVGVPPGLAFGARVLGIESTFEGGNLMGLIGLLGVVAWTVWILAAARALGLPGDGVTPGGETFPKVATAIAAFTLLAGPALPAFQTLLANPAQADVMSTPAEPVAGGLISVVTVSTVLPALTLFGPLFVLGVVAFFFARRGFARSSSRPPPFALPFADLVDRARAAARDAAVPEQYRSLANARLIESVVAGGRPVLWLASLVALGFAVTRL